MLSKQSTDAYTKVNKKYELFTPELIKFKEFKRLIK
jgi:hypothetical protein